MLSEITVDWGTIASQVGPLGVAIVIGSMVIAKAVTIVGKLFITMVGEKLNALLESVNAAKNGLIKLEQEMIKLLGMMMEFRDEFRRGHDAHSAEISGLRDLSETRPAPAVRSPTNRVNRTPGRKP